LFKATAVFASQNQDDNSCTVSDSISGMIRAFYIRDYFMFLTEQDIQQSPKTGVVKTSEEQANGNLVHV